MGRPARGEEQVPEFSDAAPPDAQVSLASTWRTGQAETRSVSVATAPLQVADVSVQATEQLEVGTQTDYGAQPSDKKRAAAAAAGARGFLTKVEGLITAQLEQARAEHAQHADGLTGRHHADPASGSAPTLLHTLQPAASPAAASAALAVTALSWSASGTTLAAAYRGSGGGRGALLVWHLRPGRPTPARPDVAVDLDVGLTACAFHPEHPALIAGGTSNGDVYIWDLARAGDPHVGHSEPLGSLRHQEPVAALVWRYSMTEAGKYGNRAQAYQLISLGSDGRVLIWAWHKVGAPAFGFQLLWPAPGGDRKILWGGTGLSFLATQLGADAPGADKGTGPGLPTSGSSTAFVVGTEGGRLFKCAYEVAPLAAKDFQKALAAGELPELRSPITDGGYTPHAGAVAAVHASPHQSAVFLTAGQDGGLRLHHALHHPPRLVLEPSASRLTGVQWSPSRPLVFAASAGDGSVYVYDLLQTQPGQLVTPAVAVDACAPGGRRMAAAALAISPRCPELLAAAAGAAITVWQLPPGLAAPRKGEHALLKRLAAADDFLEALRDALAVA